MKNVVLLGSTGSIGTSTIKVAEDLPDRIRGNHKRNLARQISVCGHHNAHHGVQLTIPNGSAAESGLHKNARILLPLDLDPVAANLSGQQPRSTHAGFSVFVEDVLTVKCERPIGRRQNRRCRMQTEAP